MSFLFEVPKTEHSTRGEASPVPSTGQDDFPSAAHHTVPDPSQDAIGLLGHLGTLLAYVQLSDDQHPQVHFFYTVFQSLCFNPVALPEVVVAKVQDPTLGLVELHPTGLSPVIQPVQNPL